MKLLTRDQQRAIHAYKCVENVPKEQREEYGTRVGDLGATVLRNGLAAALAFLDREKDKPAVALLLGHLGSAELPALGKCQGKELPEKVRNLELRGYMLATRELLQRAVWFQRAVQATFEKKGKKGDVHAAGAGD